jgi:hypothetical protein
MGALSLLRRVAHVRLSSSFSSFLSFSLSFSSFFVPFVSFFLSLLPFVFSLLRSVFPSVSFWKGERKLRSAACGDSVQGRRDRLCLFTPKTTQNTDNTKTMARAIVGRAIRETGLALDRVGLAVQGDMAFREQRASFFVFVLFVWVPWQFVVESTTFRCCSVSFSLFTFAAGCRPRGHSTALACYCFLGLFPFSPAPLAHSHFCALAGSSICSPYLSLSHPLWL